MKQKQSPAEGAWEFLWGSPGLFLFVSMVLFIMRRSEKQVEVAWNLYLVAWAPLVVMGIVSLLLRKKPHMSSLKVTLVLLVVLGAFNLLVHRDSFPY
ncbi:hypothetical protein [Streptomyces sp. NPDC048639]|uniref:hypothetical protein n=1 Tax=Streptomyces sp. NPDC048639 TaxID=3365581 RepID=UPI00371749CA